MKNISIILFLFLPSLIWAESVTTARTKTIVPVGQFTGRRVDHSLAGKTQLPTSLAVDLILHHTFKFNYNAGTNTYDVGGNFENNAYSTNSSTTPTYTNEWAVFDGNGAQLTIDHHSSLNFTDLFSVCYWIKPNSSSIQGILTKSDGNPANSGWSSAYGVVGNSIDFYARDDTERYIKAYIDCPINQWSFFGANYDQNRTGNDKLRLFFNGTNVTENYVNGSLSFRSIQTNAFNVLISGYTGTDSYRLDSEIDNIQIFDRVLSSNEFEQIYHSTSNSYPPPDDTTLVLDMPFLSNQVINAGTNYLDQSTYGNDGIQESASMQPVHVLTNGAWIDFDGVNDRVEIAQHSSINNMDVFSISVWINFASWGELGAGMILNKRPSTSIGSFFLNLTENTSGYIETVQLFTDSPGGPAGRFMLPNYSLTSNIWTHIGVSYDRSNNTNVPVYYKNGIKQTTVIRAAPSGSPNGTDTSILMIGGRLDGNTTFDGAIGKLKIWNTIRTSNQFFSTYNEGNPTTL